MSAFASVEISYSNMLQIGNSGMNMFNVFLVALISIEISYFNM